MVLVNSRSLYYTWKQKIMFKIIHHKCYLCTCWSCGHKFYKHSWGNKLCVPFSFACLGTPLFCTMGPNCVHTSNPRYWRTFSPLWGHQQSCNAFSSSRLWELQGKVNWLKAEAAAQYSSGKDGQSGMISLDGYLLFSCFLLLIAKFLQPFTCSHAWLHGLLFCCLFLLLVPSLYDPTDRITWQSKCKRIKRINMPFAAITLSLWVCAEVHQTQSMITWVWLLHLFGNLCQKSGVTWVGGRGGGTCSWVHRERGWWV